MSSRNSRSRVRSHDQFTSTTAQHDHHATRISRTRASTSNLATRRPSTLEEAITVARLSRTRQENQTRLQVRINNETARAAFDQLIAPQERATCAGRRHRSATREHFRDICRADRRWRNDVSFETQTETFLCIYTHLVSRATCCPFGHRRTAAANERPHPCLGIKRGFQTTSYRFQTLRHCSESPAPPGQFAQSLVAQARKRQESRTNSVFHRLQLDTRAIIVSDSPAPYTNPAAPLIASIGQLAVSSGQQASRASTSYTRTVTSTGSPGQQSIVFFARVLASSG